MSGVDVTNLVTLGALVVTAVFLGFAVWNIKKACLYWAIADEANAKTADLIGRPDLAASCRARAARFRRQAWPRKRVPA